MSRFFFRLYPRAWRDRYGPEFQALLEDAGASRQDSWDVLKGAVKMQMTNWSFARIVVAFMVVGGLLGWLAPFGLRAQFTSQALLKFEGSGNEVAELDLGALNQNKLLSLIDQVGLYPRARQRLPTRELVNEMRKNIRMVLATPTAFTVSFAYDDPVKAQRTVQALVDDFMAENVRGRHLIRLELLDPASLPVRGTKPERPLFLTAGVGGGLLSGLLIASLRGRRKLQTAA